LEVGYSESHYELLEDTDLLITGFRGSIGLVIVVKLEHLKKGETEIQKGFAEVYRYDPEKNKKVKYRGKMV
jgi:hypothetical protein